MIFRKSKAEETKTEYMDEIDRLRKTATDPNVPVDDRIAAQEKLRELDLYHTRKINNLEVEEESAEVRPDDETKVIRRSAS